jgi:ABC-type Mn2+/Zn2+ transport system permease subunit
MIEVFGVYKFAFVLCLVAGALLSLLGAHLVSRKESLQILALAQAALVGNLFGRIVSPENMEDLGIILFSLLFFIIFKILFIYSKKIMRSSKETFYVVSYLSLISVSYIMISIFPGLEGHMAVGFFGDIVSLPSRTTFIVIGLFSLFLALIIIKRKTLLRSSFERAVLGVKKINFLEELLFALIFVVSLYSLGFLFSVSAMIFPTVIIGSRGRNLSSTLTLMSIVTSFGSVFGLGASIYAERLSTVPTQVLTILIFLSIISLLLGLRKKVGNEQSERNLKKE